MQKKTSDYDNVFKTMKMKHKRLFVSVINDIFVRNYSKDAKVEILPSEGYLTENETADGSEAIEERVSDFLIKIGSEIYLLECQSYDDGSMAIRMPEFSVIYVKRTERTPKTTIITFSFPDGRTIDYKSDNVILEDFTKEEIIEKRLFPYIPFYIARYEKEIASEGNIENVIEELAYFRDEMVRLHQAEELSDDELIDLKGFVNTIITHIANGNKNEERLVNIMGGTIIETESERLIRCGMTQGQAQMIVELGQEDGLDDNTILERLQEKIGLSAEEAGVYLKQYGKQLV